MLIRNVRLQLKYDTEANWIKNNPVLLSGEFAVSSDKNGAYKTGNGASTWNELSYNHAMTASYLSDSGIAGQLELRTIEGKIHIYSIT